MGAVDVSTEVVIDCPPSKVSAFAADPDNAPTWYVNIKNVEWKTVRRVAVGSRIAFVAHFLGRRMVHVRDRGVRPWQAAGDADG